MIDVLQGNITSAGVLAGNITNKASVSGVPSTSAELTGSIRHTLLRGLSAYEVAVENGFEGTEEEWLETLKGDKVELMAENNIIYWKYESDMDWLLLLDLNVIDYNTLINLPTLGGVTLQGDLTLEDIGIGDYVETKDFITDIKLETMWWGG